jgi:hypothetical protein
MTQTQKQTWIILAVIAALALGGFLGYQFYFKSFIEKKLFVMTIKKNNEKGPITLETGDRIDSVSILSDDKFVYHTTLVNVKKEKINIDSFINNTRERLIEGIRYDSSLQILRENKMTLGYLYRDQDGIFLYEIMVTPEMYLKK